MNADQNVVQWCTTTDLGGPGDRRDHATLVEAQTRAGHLAALADAMPDGAARPTRMTVWARVQGDPRGWQTCEVIELADVGRRAGAA